ncbi:MAG: UDP-N-acetylmuramate--alanine ligase [Candidatus Protistobacter heckmanni]|nr:UDP-N-acetylmuramate--alanine ligase [Candidatus Protistobacter heckmanni]
MSHPGSAGATLRSEIAIAAARMIAEDGLEYGLVKQKAAEMICGDSRLAKGHLPDNSQVEDEVRVYQALFQADTQPALLALLREIAALVMQGLEPFSPHLTGAVLNGTAGEHSDIHLQLFTDDAKEAAIFLLNAGIDYEVSESRHFAAGRSRPREPVETYSFLWRGQFPDTRASRQLASRLRETLGTPVGVHLAIYPRDNLRGALKPGAASGRVERAPLAVVRELLETDVAGD